MATFTKKPGDTVLPSTEDPSMAMVLGSPNFTPSYVVLPARLGGGRARVLGGQFEPCPKHVHNVWTLRLDDKLIVAECGSEFYWYTVTNV